MRTSTKTRDETGGTLIMALAYVVIVGSVVGALGGWIVNDLNNSTRFAAARAQQSALSSAVEVATQSIRYAPLIGTGLSQTVATLLNPSYCWGSSSPSTLTGVNGASISVWCSTVFSPTSTTTRVVTFSACLSTTGAAACSATPLLQSVVTFDDYPTTGGVVNTGVCTSTCGEGMAVGSWVSK
jgi:hypothetical protein